MVQYSVGLSRFGGPKAALGSAWLAALGVMAVFGNCIGDLSGVGPVAPDPHAPGGQRQWTSQTFGPSKPLASLRTLVQPTPPEQVGCHPRIGCAGTPIPLQGSPICCPGRAVARPGSGQCNRADNLSPLIDPDHGWYRAGKDPDNWVHPVGEGVLELLALHVVENGEGKGWPHGPHGNLHWDVFRPDEPIQKSPDGADERRLMEDRVLRGPHRTHDRTDEWLDDEVLTYRNAGLHRWGQHADTSGAIVLRIWESDLSEDGYLGRRDDVLGMERIRREETETPCGTWVPFHGYENSHPRIRTDHVKAWALLRTE